MRDHTSRKKQLSLRCQQRVELARAFQRVEIIAAAHMSTAHKDLGHRASAICPLDHFRLTRRIGQHVDFLKCDTLLGQQPFGRMTKSAKGRRINLDRLLHDFDSTICVTRYLGSFTRPRQYQHINVFGVRGKTGLGRRAQSRPGRHHIVNDQNVAACDVGSVPWIHRDLACGLGEPLFGGLAVQNLRLFRAQQEVGTMRKSRAGTEGLGEQSGLIVFSTQKPQPMKRYGRHDCIRVKVEGTCSVLQPKCRRAYHVLAVTVFEPKDQLAGLFPIEQRGATTLPGGPVCQTRVAHQAVARLVVARQGHTAAVTHNRADERRFSPTGSAQTKVAVHHVATGNAARWVKKFQRCLNSVPNPHISPAMTSQTALTDRAALLRNRSRASEMFLQSYAARDLQDRVSMVKKSFQRIAIVTPFPTVWEDWTATIISDHDVLALEPDSYDLVLHSLSLHWANDPVGQLIQCRRALKPDGLLLATALGGTTLHELRACLADAESRETGGLSPRVAPMAEIRDLGGLLQRAGFALPVADSDRLDVAYSDAFHLMRDLRAMGETNALTGRQRHMTRPAILSEAAKTYAEQFSTEDGKVRATFEIVTLTGYAPHDSQPKPLKPGSATNRLADVLGSAERPLKD